MLDESTRELVSGVLLALGVGIFALTLLRRLRSQQRRRAQEPDLDPRERIDETRARAAARATVDSFAADAEELTRRLAAMLDNKAARLEVLIERAEALAERLERAGPGETRLSLREDADLRPDAYGGHASADGGSGDGGGLAGGLESPVHRRVRELAASGMGSLEIARETGMPIGQIELVLSLSRGGL